MSNYLLRYILEASPSSLYGARNWVNELTEYHQIHRSDQIDVLLGFSHKTNISLP